MSRKSRNIIIGVLLLLPLSFVVAYFLAQTSEPFKYTVQTVKKSPAVQEIVGDVKSVKLAPLGYNVRYIGANAWADFQTEVEGAKDSKTLFVKLERNLGKWEIVGARLGDAIVDIR
jgi:hypothetical protein